MCACEWQPFSTLLKQEFGPPKEFGVGGGDKGFHYWELVVGTGTLKFEVV